MKTQTMALFAILTVGIGLTGFSSATMFPESDDLSGYGESSAISGHMTVIHKDAQGSIIGYQQTDNIITNEGLSCLTEVLFAATNSTTCAAASATDQFDTIGLLGSGGSGNAEDTASSLTILTGGGLDRTAATTIGVDVEGDGSGTTQGKSVTGLQHTFTKSNATSATVGGAVVANGAGDAVFAAKAFSGGDITLNENDTLEITWSIQIGS